MTLEWSATALADLDRFAAFLHDRDPRLASIIAARILAKAQIIETHPQLGRPIEGRVTYREISLQVLNAPYAFRTRLMRFVMLMTATVSSCCAFFMAARNAGDRIEGAVRPPRRAA